MGKAKGVLKNFLIEPFVPHTQVMYASILSFSLTLSKLLSLEKFCGAVQFVSSVVISSVVT